MTRYPILLVGSGGHARACLDVIEQEKDALLSKGRWCKQKDCENIARLSARIYLEETIS